MSIKKRTIDIVKKVAHEAIVLGRTLTDISKSYDISRRTAKKALEDALFFDIITREELNNYTSNSNLKGYLALKCKFDNDDDLREHYSTMGKKSACNGLDMHAEYGRLGGYETQRLHKKKVAKNLRNAKHYGSTYCKFGDIEFASKGERITALLLKKYGLLDEIIEGENFQKEFNGTKNAKIKVDFYINDKLIVEYHPIPKQDFSNSKEETYRDIPRSLDEYLQTRADALSNYFNGKIVLISAPTGSFSATTFYKQFSDLGISDTWEGFLDKYRTIKEEIKLDEAKQLSELTMLDLDLNLVPKITAPF